MFLLIDNYDSFTYNLVHYLGELGADVRVLRNDALTALQALAMRPEGIVISPGPCDPDKAGICLELIHKAAETGVPLLGVCLGHQAIGQAFGGDVVRAPTPVHGKTSAIHHSAKGLFAGIPSPFKATRYHSLVVERATLPEPGGHRLDRGRPDHGPAAQEPDHPRGAVPPREHRLGAWP